MQSPPPLFRVAVMSGVLVVVGVAQASAVDGKHEGIAGAAYRNLEPFCGTPRVAFLCQQAESAWVGLADAERRYAEIKRSQGRLAAQLGDRAVAVSLEERKAVMDLRGESYAAAREKLIVAVSDLEQDSEQSLHDILILAWRLNSSDRHELLRDTMARSMPFERLVLETLQRCILEEIALVDYKLQVI